MNLYEDQIVTEIRANAKVQHALWGGNCINRVTSFGFYDSKKPPKERFKNYTAQICLGALNRYSNFPKLNFDWFYILHKVHQDSDATRAWLRWLLDPNVSPWRDIVRAQIPQNVDRDVWGNCFCFNNLDFASNYFVNFLTAWRACWEKPFTTTLWYNLVSGGASPASAYLVTGMVQSAQTYNPDKISMYLFDQGHYAISPTTYGLCVAHRMTNNLPNTKTFLTNKFKENTSYIPCNVVWRPVKGESHEFKRQLVSFLDKGQPLDAPKTKRLFRNPQLHMEESDAGRYGTSVTNLSTLLKFCIWLDALQPGKDFSL